MQGALGSLWSLAVLWTQECKTRWHFGVMDGASFTPHLHAATCLGELLQGLPVMAEGELGAMSENLLLRISSNLEFAAFGFGYEPTGGCQKRLPQLSAVLPWLQLPSAITPC